MEKAGGLIRRGDGLDDGLPLKDEIKKSLEKYGNKYDGVNLVISIKQDGLSMYCISTNTDLINDLTDTLGKEIDLSDIPDELLMTKNN